MTTAKERYEALALARQPFLDRARDYAELTIPSLLPRAGHNHTSRLPEPNQSFGSRCVLTLSNQLLIALLPPGIPFFRFQVPPETVMLQSEMKTDEEVQRLLAMTEQLAQVEVERKGWRQPTNVALQLLIVTGNALEQTLPDDSLRVFRLDQYVVLRDASGNVLEIVLVENIARDALPIEAQSVAPAPKKGGDPQDIEIYTWVRRQPDGAYRVHQEIEGKKVPKSDGVYAVSPFRALRWSIVPGEDYGRGKIEEHSGDIKSFDLLSKNMLDGAAMAARHVTMIRPNATGNNLKRKVASANNGDVIIGNPEDVAMLKFEKIAELQIVQAELQRLSESLAAAFMLNSGMRRDAERVTAYELRLLAEELEGNLGGTYSLLSQEMQLPRVQRLVYQMQRNGKLPEWGDGAVEPIITTGLEALGREQDLVKVQTITQLIAGLPQEALDYVPWPDLLKKAFIGVGLPGNVRSDREVAELRMKRAMAEAAARGLGQPAPQLEGA